MGSANNWQGPAWDSHIAEFTRLAGEQCKTYIAGIPQTGAPTGEIICPPYPTHPDLVVWPESPAPFDRDGPALRKALVQRSPAPSQAPLVVGGIGWDLRRIERRQWHYYNSALIVGRRRASAWAATTKSTSSPSASTFPSRICSPLPTSSPAAFRSFTRGSERNVFLLPTQNGGSHRYGVFICYEAVFADEVRQFARLGAEVLVNISDDGWYGDTSAPWQHLNMARMRAIENRRWLLRDTNNGVTAVIDPYGRVRQSIPRHQTDALPAEFGFRDDITFYTAHGDVFAWLCRC